MVIVGNFNNGNSFDPEQVYGVCRFSECTLSNGKACHTATSGLTSKQFAESIKYHPGFATVSNGKFQCTSILGAGKDVQQKNDMSNFDVLIVN